MSREVITIQEPTEVPFEEIPRYEYANPLKYDKLTLARRKTEVNAILRDYPNVSRTRAEEIWDYIYITGEDKIKENIDKGIYDQKPQKRQISEGKIEIENPSNNLVLDNNILEDLNVVI